MNSSNKNQLSAPTCSSCSTSVERTNNKLHLCVSCKKLKHGTCGSFTITINEKGEKRRTCKLCTTSRMSSTSTTTPAPSLDNLSDNSLLIQPTINPVTDLILSKLDALQSSNAALEKKIERLSAVENKLDSIAATIEAIPQLVLRLEATETGLAVLQQEHTALQQRLEAIESAPPGSLASTNELKDLQIDVARNAEALEKLELTTAAASSSELLISGISFLPGTDLRKASYAILVAVHKHLELRDVVAARSFGPSKKASALPGSLASTSASSSSSSANITSASSSSLPQQRLTVTLSSRALLHEIIGAKARSGKLHTNQLDPDLLHVAGCTTSLHPSLININELLPRREYQLRKLVREKAKEAGSCFTQFVRRGQLYVRRKEGETAPVPINVTKDFERFLVSFHSS